MKSVMLYFGSFNPVHAGHMAVAEYVLEERLCGALWFVVSPRSPLKADELLVGQQDRLDMVNTAIDYSRFGAHMKACDIEFGLPRPSYTIDTMRALLSRCPDTRFSLLIGSDITGQIEKWKEWDTLLDSYPVYVYPRPGYSVSHPERFTVLADAPGVDYSSTDVRSRLARGEDVSGMLPEGVYEYIKQHRLWMK